jgi:hypothetical protein
MGSIFGGVKKMINYAAINNKLLALKKLGVGEFGHLNGNLESHLLGTYELLVEWNNPAYIWGVDPDLRMLKG